MKRFALAAVGLAVCTMFVMLSPSTVSAAPSFHYAKGKIARMQTRATIETTWFRIEGSSCTFILDYGGESETERRMRSRQFATLLAADLTGRKVIVEYFTEEACNASRASARMVEMCPMTGCP